MDPTLTGYVLIFYWTIVAIGGALFLGTAAAVLRYRRTGTFPGEAGEAGAAHIPSGRVLRRATVRCVLGLCLAMAGAVGLFATF